MASKFLVPLEVPNYVGTPADKADAGFALLYIKHGWVTRQDAGGVETDLVLSRPLDGFSLPLTAEPVTNADTVKSALEKLQQSLLSVTLSGDVTGTAAYNAGILEIVTTYNGNTASSVATAFDTNHYAGIANPYIAGDIVYKDGHIFQALYTNDAILPTIGGNLYWQDLGVGNVLRQAPVDWNATSGDYQILNKPNIPTLVSELTNDLGFLSAEVDTLDSVTARGNTTLNTITVDGVTATGPTSTIYAGTGTKLRTEANNLVFERESSSGFMKFYINQTTLSPTAKSYLGYNNATLNVVLSNEFSTGNLELRTQDIIRQHIFANGNVVIGSASPTDGGYKLDVNGSVRAQGIFYGIDIRTGAHSFRDQMHISHTADGFTRQTVYNAAGAHALTFIGDLRFASSAAIKSVFAFNGTYSNNGTIYTGEMSLMKIFTGDAIGNTVNSTGLDNYGINLMPTLNYTTGTSTFTGFFYNPTLTSTTGLTHYAMDLVTGLIKFRVLAGASTRMVVADAAGILSTQTIPTGFTLPSLTSGSVLFSDGTTIAQDNANFFWDNTNSRLGIGTASPAYGIDIAGAIGQASSIRTGWGVYSRYLINPTATATYIEFQPSTHQINFGINGTEAMRIPSTRNVLIGTTTDAGYKLDVNGTARVSGLTRSTDVFVVGGAATTNTANARFWSGGGQAVTSGLYRGFYTDIAWIPTSGSAEWYGLDLRPTINQTGGANGITRGLYINPTLTAAADFRAIETSNGKVIFGGTGNVLIGTTTDAGFKLDVNGTARVVTSLAIGNSAGDNVLTLSPQSSGNAIVVNNNGYVKWGTVSYIRGFSTSTLFSVLNSAFTNVFNIGTSAASYINTGSSFVIGATTANSSALLQADSTTQGFLPPRMTTTQKNAIASPAAGLVVYDSTDNKHYGYDGTAWVSLASTGGTVTSVALATGTTGTDVNVSGSPVTGSGTITLNIPDASATARGVVTTGAQSFTGAKTFSSPHSIIVATATLVNASFGSNISTTYVAGTNISGTSIYGERNSMSLQLGSNVYSGSASNNVAAQSNEVYISGGAGSTQPFRALITSLSGQQSLPAMNIADFRYMEIKTPFNNVVTGHTIGLLTGLYINPLQGATGFTTSVAYSIYQVGSSDINRFNGYMQFFGYGNGVTDQVLTIDSDGNMVARDYTNFGLQAALNYDAVLTQDNTIDGNGYQLLFDNLQKTGFNSNAFVDINVDDGTQQARVLTTVFGGGPAAVNLYASSASGTTGIDVTSTGINIRTFSVATKTAGDVLTLVDPLTGEVEYATPSGGVTSSESIINALIFG